jgi:tetratricopeptide (TPR) repeat protein
VIRMRFALLILVLLLAVPAFAQETNTAPTNVVTTLPASFHLTGFTIYLQELNRCSAAAMSIYLSYYKDNFKDDYWIMKRRLNPSLEDVSVRVEEMARVAEEYGLKAIVRRGGTLDLLKSLVANGFPVLIENAIYEGNDAFRDWMSHNRVMTGYDDTTGNAYFWDSSLGNGPDDMGILIPYDQLDEIWRPFNRDYLIVYKAEDEARLQAVLGQQWDEAYNAQWTLDQALADREAGKVDSFTTYNIGWAQLQLGQVAEAVESMETARAVGLPWRFFWYDYSLLEAWREQGKWEDMLWLIHETIQKAPGVEELYYYAAFAYEGQGNTERAKLNFEAALSRNPFFIEAKTELNRMNGVGV